MADIMSGPLSLRNLVMWTDFMCNKMNHEPLDV